IPGVEVVEVAELAGLDAPGVDEGRDVRSAQPDDPTESVGREIAQVDQPVEGAGRNAEVCKRCWGSRARVLAPPMAPLTGTTLPRAVPARVDGLVRACRGGGI